MAPSRRGFGGRLGAAADEPAFGRFGQETDNAAKYERAGRLERSLLSRFRDRLVVEVRALAPSSVLDAGCGEGYVTAWIAEVLDTSEITCVEGRAEALGVFRRRNPALRAVKGDLAALPFPEGAFELVICTEVLEHASEPRQVLRELARVCDGHLLLTVPHEPFFRVGNLVRGRYVSRLGSTPGHLSTWGRRGFLEVVTSEAEPVRWISMFPWQGVLARPAGRVAL
jgi:SAM-dependent methyltransferase